MIKQIPMIKKIKKRTVSPKTLEKNPKRIVSLKVFNKLQKLKKTVIKKIRVGTVCKFKITALGLNNIGIDDRSKKYSVLIPNAKFGQTVKAKILKIHSKQNKYAIARLIEVLDQGSSSEIKILPGSIKEINIEKINEKGTGIVELENNYKLIIPNAKSSIQTVQITRVKAKYAFAQAMNPSKISITSSNSDQSSFTEGSKLTLIIPKTIKKYGKYLILKLNKSFIFIKSAFQVKIGNKIRIKLTKVQQNFALANIVRINPSSSLKKQKFVKYSVFQMLKNGVHLGEKASKCHAKMRNYIWVRQHRKNKKDQHSINLLKTHRCLNKALDRLTKYAYKGRTFLFIGTKQVTAGLIARASLLTKTSFFVNTRWLGGMLTNWETIFSSICKIQPVLQEKQVIIREILRQRIEIRAKVFKNLAFCQKNILKKLTAKKNQLLLKNLENPRFADFLVEQFKNRQEILELINHLKQDKKKLKNLILKKEFENRLVASKSTGLETEIQKQAELKIESNKKWIQFANSTRNHITLLLSFLIGKDIGKNPLLNPQLKKLIQGKTQRFEQTLTNEQMAISQSDSLIIAERNIKKLFKGLEKKRDLNAPQVNVKQVLLLKKLLKVLPSLKRFFSISKVKLIHSVDIFMRKIIDLKFKRSFKIFFNLIYRNYIFSNSKKLAYATKKKWQRLEKYLGGISNMIKFSRKAIYNNIAIIIGQKEEMNAVRECKKLGIEMFHIVDTNCNPSFADHIIPANDDSKNSIKYILTKILVRIRLGQQLGKKMNSVNINRFKKALKTKVSKKNLLKTKTFKNKAFLKTKN